MRYGYAHPLSCPMAPHSHYQLSSDSTVAAALSLLFCVQGTIRNGGRTLFYCRCCLPVSLEVPLRLPNPMPIASFRGFGCRVAFELPHFGETKA